MIRGQIRKQEGKRWLHVRTAATVEKMEKYRKVVWEYKYRFIKCERKTGNVWKLYVQIDENNKPIERGSIMGMKGGYYAKRNRG